MEKSDIGVIGLGVMGSSLAQNIESKGYSVSVYNRILKDREQSVVKKFMEQHGSGRHFQGYETLTELADSLKTPRKILIMVSAGNAVDELIARLLPYLSPGDILIDGGNSNYKDTERRVKYLEEHHFYFIGAGISGGQEGALHGPSIMPGGSAEAWPEVKPLLQRIAAKAEDGTPCCEWIGEGGAGHFVKMVHNGIEYADMQLIAEAYFVMRRMLNAGNPNIAEHFEEWNKGKLNSYLIGITARILRHTSPDGSFLIDRILDVSGQKGTGQWTVISSLEQGVPLDLIASSVFARYTSARKDFRTQMAKRYETDSPVFTHKPGVLIQEVHDALYGSKLISYTQGFELIQEASNRFNWHLNPATIARIWLSGCIIRADLLNHIAEIFDENRNLPSLLLSEYFKTQISETLPEWKSLVIKATRENTAIPAFSAALHYFYSQTTTHLPANLIQAQRDYFGAHTFERTDTPRGQFFHEEWE